jgi:hypothetical protein
MPKIVNLYLSGPMYLGKEQATKWRDEVKTIIDTWVRSPGNGHVVQFNIQDPCDRWYDDKKLLLDNGGFVVQMDKMEIAKSHVVLVNATDPGWGTPMEQYIAFNSFPEKMVIAFSECDYPSIWVKAHSHMMFKEHRGAAYYICGMAKNLAKAV